MITAVDTNILLDFLIPRSPGAASSEALLDEAYEQGALIIGEAVYAELSSRFLSQEELEEFLLETGVRLEQSRNEALYAASQAWSAYTGRRGRGLQCPRFGGSLQSPGPDKAFASPLTIAHPFDAVNGRRGGAIQ